MSLTLSLHLSWVNPNEAPDTHELAVSSFLSSTNVHLGIKSPIHVFAHTIYPMPQTKRDAQPTDLLLLTQRQLKPPFENYDVKFHLKQGRDGQYLAR